MQAIESRRVAMVVSSKYRKRILALPAIFSAVAIVVFLIGVPCQSAYAANDKKCSTIVNEKSVDVSPGQTQGCVYGTSD
jgi:hypothetical protein